MQLLQPVLTFGLLVLARLCRGMSLVMVVVVEVVVEDEAEVEEMAVGAGECECRCGLLLASSGAMLISLIKLRRSLKGERVPLPTYLKSTGDGDVDVEGVS